MHDDAARELFFEGEEGVFGAEYVHRGALFHGDFHARKDAECGEAVHARRRKLDRTDDGRSADRQLGEADARHRTPAGDFGLTRFVMSSTIREVGGNSYPHAGQVTRPQPFEIWQPAWHAAPSSRVKSWPHMPHSIMTPSLAGHTSKRDRHVAAGARRAAHRPEFWYARAMALESCTLDDLEIDDEKSFRHVALYEALKSVLRTDRYRFLVPAGGGEGSWSRTLFLNLTYWSPSAEGDVLAGPHLDADVVAHVAWHHVAKKALANVAPCAGGLFLGESIASAFDVYLVGRLLGHAPESSFLETQVPAMVDAAVESGASERDVQALLDAVVKDPERAFEDLRELLFDAALALAACTDPREADAVLDRFASHRFACFLHHFELSTWVLYAKAYAPAPAACGEAVRAIDASLRSAPDALAWLESTWLAG